MSDPGYYKYDHGICGSHGRAGNWDNASGVSGIAAVGVLSHP